MGYANKRYVPKTKKTAEGFCGRCPMRAKCKEPCVLVQKYADQGYHYQRELTVPHVREHDTADQNTLLDMLDLGRANTVVEYARKSAFSMEELESIYSPEYNYPFLRVIENKALALSHGHGLSYKRIGYKLKVPEREVKNILERAHRKLEKN